MPTFMDADSWADQRRSRAAAFGVLKFGVGFQASHRVSCTTLPTLLQNFVDSAGSA